VIGLGIGINAYGTTSAQAQAVREAYLAFRSRVLADGGEIPSPPLAQSFLRAVYAQELNSSLVFAGLPAYKTTTDLVDKWYDINENDGAGTTTTRPELVGFAPDFDGTDDYIEITHNANQLLTGGGCFMAWVNIDSQALGTASSALIDKSSGITGTNGWRWGVRGSDFPGGLFFQINNGTVVSTPNSVVSLGVWVHVAVVFTAGGGVTMYVNGESEATGTTGAASGITTTNAPRLGNRSTATDRPFDGEIVLPAIFNSQPTASQVLAIYNQTSRYFT
jgi:hypothetical protein